MIEEINQNDPKIPIDNVHQAVIEKSTGYLFCIYKKKNEEFLYIYDKSLSLITKLNPPDGFSFYYISRNHDGVGVVCTQIEKKFERDDWFFSYDKKKRSLLRVSPAY